MAIRLFDTLEHNVVELVERALERVRVDVHLCKRPFMVEQRALDDLKVLEAVGGFLKLVARVGRRFDERLVVVGVEREEERHHDAA